MLVEILPKDWGDSRQPLDIPFSKYIDKMGLKYVIDTVYKVIDEQLFFLAVIKHGISYMEWKNRIEIYGNGWGTYNPIISNIQDIGIKYPRREAGTNFEIVDKELFFLSVIKYGITFNEVKI